VIGVPYAKQAAYYDKIYAAIGKDYADESEKICEYVSSYKQASGKKLLDVACGTGVHLEHLIKHFDCQGLDLEVEMLEIAASRLPDITFHHGDMRVFNLNERFDVITCLFSSIGYMQNVEELNQAIDTIAKHLVSGGVLLVEAWLNPDQWEDGHVGAVFVNEPKLKISRINNGLREGNISIMNMNYTIGTPEGVKHFEEIHRMALFTVDEYLSAFKSAGLQVHHDPESLMGRGIYIGVKS